MSGITEPPLTLGFSRGFGHDLARTKAWARSYVIHSTQDGGGEAIHGKDFLCLATCMQYFLSAIMDIEDPVVGLSRQVSPLGDGFVGSWRLWWHEEKRLGGQRIYPGSAPLDGGKDLLLLD